MTPRQVKNKLEKIVNEIDEYLYELEQEGKDNTEKYEQLLYIAGGLHELIDTEV